MAKKMDYAVLGLGKFGSSIALTLSRNGCEVLAVDIVKDIVQDVSEEVTHAVQADVTDPDALNALGIRNFDVVVIGISENMQASILSTILVKEMGVPFVIAKAQNDIHKKVLEKVGADKVIFPEREIGVRIANNLISKNFLDYVELSDQHSIVEIAVLPDWIGKSLKELDLRNKYKINVMAIRKENNGLSITPGPDDVLNEKDVIVVIGKNTELQKLRMLG